MFGGVTGKFRYVERNIYTFIISDHPGDLLKSKAPARRMTVLMHQKIAT